MVACHVQRASASWEYLRSQLAIEPAGGVPIGPAGRGPSSADTNYSSGLAENQPNQAKVTTGDNVASELIFCTAGFQLEGAADMYREHVPARLTHWV